MRSVSACLTRPSWLLSLWLGVFSAFAGVDRSLLAEPAPRPNVLLVVMDDMGYGDLSCHGSPHIATPHLDALYASAMRLTDFHVAPMCSPTRGQLLTGLDAMRNGSTVVAGSRMMVRADVPMAPALFAAAGYATGQFGKWHLGENHPHRPQDRGFQECLWFPLQEISSLSDYWGNDYFDPVLRRRDGQPRPFTSYCTDVSGKMLHSVARWGSERGGGCTPGVRGGAATPGYVVRRLRRRCSAPGL
jgi:arylsulfatase